MMGTLTAASHQQWTEGAIKRQKKNIQICIRFAILLRDPARKPLIVLQKKLLQLIRKLVDL